MLNVGLIGKFDTLEKQIESLVNYTDIRIQGKSSVGIKDQASDYRFAIPEYNRIELIERCDAIFLEDTTLVPYELIKESIKRNKHIFLLEFPKFSDEQCQELIKLVDEANTIVQIKNPYYYLPQIQYISAKSEGSFYIDFKIGLKDSTEIEKIVSELVLLSINLIDKDIIKIKPTALGKGGEKFLFRNFRFDFSDASVLNIDFINSDEDSQICTFYTGKEFFKVDFCSGLINGIKGPVKINNQSYKNEVEAFFASIKKKQFPLSGISEYVTIVDTVKSIQNKLNVTSL